MLKDLSIWQRLGLIAVTPSISITLLLYLGVTEQAKAIAAERQAERATAYAVSLKRVFADLQEHRGLSVAVLDGEVKLGERQAQKRADLESSLQALATLDQQLGKQLQTGERVQALNAAWARLKSELPALGAREAAARHGALIAEVLGALDLVAHNAGLNRVGDAAAWNLADALVVKLPRLAEALGQLRALGPALVAAVPAPPPPALAAPVPPPGLPLADRLQLATLHADAAAALAEVREAFGYAGRASPRLTAQLGTPLDELANETLRLLELVDAKVLKPERPTVEAAAVYAQASRASSAALKVLDGTASSLEAALGEQRARKEGERVLWIAIFVLTSVIGQVSLLVIARSITRPLKELSVVAEKISLGDLDAKIDLARKDEIGALSEQFARMQASLRVIMNRLESGPRPGP